MRVTLALLCSLMAQGVFSQNTTVWPDILRFEPKQGTTGTVVHIVGRNLGTTNKVRFGGVLASSFTVVNDSVVKATVGAGASGRIQVNTTAGEDTISYFTFLSSQTTPPLPLNCDKIRDFQPVINGIQQDLVCYRDSVIKLQVVNGGDFRSYRWSNGDTTPYTYVRGNETISVRVGNAALNCFSKVTTVKFVRNTGPMPELVFRDSVLRVRPPATYYRWYFNANPAGNDSLLRAVKVGVYRVETSNDKVCWNSSKPFSLTVGSLVPPRDSLALKIYPNPSTGPFTVAVILPTVRTVRIAITITDVTGSVVYRSPAMTMTGKEIHIPLQLLKKGVYRVKAELNNKTITRVLYIQ